jgi:hypothetical protein
MFVLRSSLKSEYQEIIFCTLFLNPLCSNNNSSSKKKNKRTGLKSIWGRQHSLGCVPSLPALPTKRRRPSTRAPAGFASLPTTSIPTMGTKRQKSYMQKRHQKPTCQYDESHHRLLCRMHLEKYLKKTVTNSCP